MLRVTLLPVALVLACTPAGERAESPASTGMAPGDTAAAAAGVDSLMARFLDAYNRNDAKALAETYSEDVNFMLEGVIVHGRAAVEKGWSDNVAALDGLTFTPIERVISGDVAVLTDRFEQKTKMPGGKTVVDSGYSLAMVRREADGRWRWHSVMLSRPPEKR